MFGDNSVREEEFKKICEKKIPKFMPYIQKRNVYIWGAGRGGKIVEAVVKRHGINVRGFLDQRAGEIPDYLGYKVKTIEEVDSKYDFIVISLMSFKYEIVEALESHNFSCIDYFYLYENEGYNKEDVIYKGCKVGRYTYGYKALLENYPLAISIGRYCSINATARIWNNHPIGYVTTHPILDCPVFYSQEQYDERKQFILKYGIHFNNVEYENSPLRQNEPIIIGNDVWIGANVVILPGVSVGDGAILAAGAVVTKDIDPYAIVGGVPAKVIKYRFREEEIKKFLKIQWWNWSIDKIESNIEMFYQPEKFLESFYNML